MADEKKKRKESGWSVFEIENVNSKSKQHGKKIFIATSSMTQDNILSRIRSMQDSKTGRGGNKEISKDIKAAGEDYKEDFKVTLVDTGMERHEAEDRKASLISKHNKLYNQSVHVHK